MTYTNIIMTLAVFLGPIVAIYVSKLLDKYKIQYEKKLGIYRVLMVTRSAGLSKYLKGH